MVSPEILRRYPIFSGFTHEQLVTLAQHAQQIEVPENHQFFAEGDELAHFYLVINGKVKIYINVTDPGGKHSLTDQLTGKVQSVEETISTVGSGEFFGWSAVIPPVSGTAGAKALRPSTLVAFDGAALLELFEEDASLGYRFTQLVAQVIRQRLRDMRIELLATVSEL